MTRKTLLKGKALSTVDLLVLRLVAFDIANIIYYFTKQSTLMKRSTVLNLLLKFVFA